MKSAGKARSNGLYRHIRTSKEIIRNLLNDYMKHNYNISFYHSVHHNRVRVIIMDELKITKRTEPVMFTIRVDKSIVDFYDDLAQKTNRSRNELIGLALEYAKDKIKIEP